jgi:hypothetical protein
LARFATLREIVLIRYLLSSRQDAKHAKGHLPQAH